MQKLGPCPYLLVIGTFFNFMAPYVLYRMTQLAMVKLPPPVVEKNKLEKPLHFLCKTLNYFFSSTKNIQECLKSALMGPNRHI
jgi:hypothetical protein